MSHHDRNVNTPWQTTQTHHDRQLKYTMTNNLNTPWQTTQTRYDRQLKHNMTDNSNTPWRTNVTLWKTTQTHHDRQLQHTMTGNSNTPWKTLKHTMTDNSNTLWQTIQTHHDKQQSYQDRQLKHTMTDNSHHERQLKHTMKDNSHIHHDRQLKHTMTDNSNTQWQTTVTSWQTTKTHYGRQLKHTVTDNSITPWQTTVCHGVFELSIMVRLLLLSSSLVGVITSWVSQFLYLAKNVILASERYTAEFLYNLRTAKGFEKCSQNEGRVGYLPLESNIRIFFFFFFFAIGSRIFSSFLSFSPFSYSFSCAIRMLGHLSRAWLVFTGLRYKGRTVNRTFLVRKVDHFFLTAEAFCALSLSARELVLILLSPRILPY